MKEDWSQPQPADFQNLRKRAPLNFDDTEEDFMNRSDHHDKFDCDIEVLSLYQPKDLATYGQRVTLGSQNVPIHLKQKQ